MNILITICARGGSKGIPGKNTKPLNGKPLIAYSIEMAKKFAELHSATIGLSTDSEEIKHIAKEFGIETSYIRPDILATDQSGKMDAIEDLLYYEEKCLGIKFDFVLDLDVTSPLRTLEDLNLSFEMLKNDTKALTLFSVNPANRNPYFNMVEKQENGYYGLIKKGTFLTRQSSPDVYDMNASFEFLKRGFFERNNNASITEASLIYVMPHICFDLDHSIDFEFMQYLLVNNKLGFEV